MPKIWTDTETTPFLTCWREAKIYEVVDADTIDLLVDIGLDCRGIYARCRLLDGDLKFVDAWETKGEERVQGLKAEEAIKVLLPVGAPVRVLTKMTKKLRSEKEKYGRWAATIAFPVVTGDHRTWHSLGDHVVEHGLGRRA